jgi:hypothetical protein
MILVAMARMIVIMIVVMVMVVVVIVIMSLPDLFRGGREYTECPPLQPFKKASRRKKVFPS